MLLKNVFLKTLRDNRVMLLGWGLFLAAITAFSANAYAGVETGTVAERARILADAKGLAAARSLPGGPAYRPGENISVVEGNVIIYSKFQDFGLFCR